MTTCFSFSSMGIKVNVIPFCKENAMELNENMKSRAPIIKANGEIRTLSAADMQLFKPAKEVLQPVLYEELLAMNKAAKDLTPL